MALLSKAVIYLRSKVLILPSNMAFAHNLGAAALPQMWQRGFVFGREVRSLMCPIQRPPPCISRPAQPLVQADACSAGFTPAPTEPTKSRDERTFSTRAHEVSSNSDKNVEGEDVREDDDYVCSVREADLEEQFVRGSGPGGQKINKSAVCVVRFPDVTR